MNDVRTLIKNVLSKTVQTVSKNVDLTTLITNPEIKTEIIKDIKHPIDRNFEMFDGLNTEYNIFKEFEK